MDHYKQIYMPMGLTAEIVAERYKMSREAQDEYALASQQRTAAFQKSGKFKDEIVPMTVTMEVTDKATGQTSREAGHGRPRRVQPSRDHARGPRRSWRRRFKETGSVTAGNASQFSDGAAAVLIMSAEKRQAHSASSRSASSAARVFAGCEADEMGIGPVFAVPKLLKRAGLTIDDIDIVELNEAFASQVVYCRDELGIPMEKLNPNGGSISIGHPYGMTGARMTGTLLLELQRQKQALGHRHHVHRRRHGRRGALRGGALSAATRCRAATGW